MGRALKEDLPFGILRSFRIFEPLTAIHRE